MKTLFTIKDHFDMDCRIVLIAEAGSPAYLRIDLYQDGPAGSGGWEEGESRYDADGKGYAEALKDVAHGIVANADGISEDSDAYEVV